MQLTLFSGLLAKWDKIEIPRRNINNVIAFWKAVGSCQTKWLVWNFWRHRLRVKSAKVKVSLHLMRLISDLRQGLRNLKAAMRSRRVPPKSRSPSLPSSRPLENMTPQCSTRCSRRAPQGEYSCRPRLSEGRHAQLMMWTRRGFMVSQWNICTTVVVLRQIQTESAYLICFLIYYVNVLPGSTCFGLPPSYDVALSGD